MRSSLHHSFSQVAAPVFARMAQYLVRRAGLPPVLISESNVINGSSTEQKRHTDLQQRAVNELKKAVEEEKGFPNLLGRVDGFDEDEGKGESDQG